MAACEWRPMPTDHTAVSCVSGLWASTTGDRITMARIGLPWRTVRNSGGFRCFASFLCRERSSSRSSGPRRAERLPLRASRRPAVAYRLARPTRADRAAVARPGAHRSTIADRCSRCARMPKHGGRGVMGFKCPLASRGRCPTSNGVGIGWWCCSTAACGVLRA